MEAGHGKGPCDGIGGTAKLMADEAVRHEKLKIENTEDFFAWGKRNTRALVTDMYRKMITSEKAKTDLTAFGELSPVVGTMKPHAVISNGLGIICVRDTSCFCQRCFHSRNFHTKSDCGWRKLTV